MKVNMDPVVLAECREALAESGVELTKGQLKSIINHATEIAQVVGDRQVNLRLAPLAGGSVELRVDLVNQRVVVVDLIEEAEA